MASAIVSGQCTTEGRSGAEEGARRWRASLPPAMRRSSVLRGGLIFLISALIYWGLFAGAIFLPLPWQRVACIVFLPFLIGSLFVIGHDAAHNSLTSIGWLNRFLGRLAMLPAWHPYTAWSHAHNTLHHGGTNLRGKHPDFVPLTKEEYDRLPLWRRLLERLYRSPIGPGINYFFDFYFRFLLFPSGPRRSPFRLAFELDRLLVIGFIGLQFAGVWYLSHFTPGLLVTPFTYSFVLVLIPWFSWLYFMGFMSFIQHTHPLLAWYDDPAEWSFYHVQLKSSTHVMFPWPIERLLNNIMDHAAHHIDPTIPLYNLPESQRLLEQTCPEHAAVIRWTPWQFWETCQVCKLYDFKRHCWTDFAGRATSPCNLPELGFTEGMRAEKVGEQPQSSTVAR